MNPHSELELNSTSNFALTGRHLGSEHGCQDYSGMLTLAGARIVNEAWLLALAAQRDELLAALEAALEVLDNVQGDINPERGYADELEADVSLAVGTARAAIYAAKGGAQ